MNCEETERLAKVVSIRCKRRIGEQLIEMKEEGVIAKGSNQMSNETTSKLSDLNITRDQSSNYQAIAAIPEPEFDAIAEAAMLGKQEVSVKKLAAKGKEYKAVASGGSVQRRNPEGYNISAKLTPELGEVVKKCMEDLDLNKSELIALALTEFCTNHGYMDEIEQ